MAILKGRLEGSGSIEQQLQGKAASSSFRVEQHTILDSGLGGGQDWGCCLTTASLWPHTGRNHQLRKHMAYLGHPILGDSRYR